MKTSARHNLLIDRRGLKSLKGGYFKDREKDGKPIWYFNRIGFCLVLFFWVVLAFHKKLFVVRICKKREELKFSIQAYDSSMYLKNNIKKLFIFCKQLMNIYSPNQQGLDWRRSIDILQLGIQKLKPRRSVAAPMKVAMMMIGGIPSQKHHHHKKELYWECKFDNSTEPTKAWRTFLKNCLFLCCQVTIKIKSAIDTIRYIFKISHYRLSSHAISVMR